MLDLFKYENKYKYDYFVAGIDEAGRGPLAGPVVCAAVIMPLYKGDIIEGINDSKQLSEKKRDYFYEKIIKTCLTYSVSIIDRETIDKINILNATKLGMKQAFENLTKPNLNLTKPIIVLTDAVKINIDSEQINIIHGDMISYNIAAASILAKVTRDRLMKDYAKRFPQYGFEQHKGYPTKLHYQKLKEFGKCELHRDSYLKKVTDEYK